MTGIASPQRLQEAIDAGRIPPSILVFPSLNVDGGQPDCVNIAGRPAVGTWTAEEIPRMIQATFPNVTTQRAGWMIMGNLGGRLLRGPDRLRRPAALRRGGGHVLLRPAR